MRIDKFLNAVNVVKRRAVSEDMCKSGVVSINDVVCKPAKELKIGDIITIKFLKGEKKYEVLSFPTTKNTPKSKQSEYIKEL
ncbi:MAG: RNA-binding S4 domain-containing protein [Campylobacteraceae bacterium]|nr:RNA-binding S4 domain-containing protein [Campylobacteraceae bacterium]